jgi:hypothetical protein
VVVLVIGELWRPATFRYVRDARRKAPVLGCAKSGGAVVIAMAVIFRRGYLMRSILLLLLGVPIPIVLLIAILSH